MTTQPNTNDADREVLWQQFIETLPVGAQLNITDAAKRGESITKYAFDFALLHARKVPDGFVLMPIEPTEEMLYAMHEALYDVRSKVWHDGLQFVYSKTLAAAPLPPSKE